VWSTKEIGREEEEEEEGARVSEILLNPHS
jgi:hypothetical protein